MHKIVQSLRSSTFIKHNAIFFFGAIAAGALNYIFYPIMARLLPTGSFGEVQVLISLFTQINIFLSVLGLLTVNIVVNSKNATQRDQVIIELEKLALIIGLLLMAGSLLAGASLQRFFRFTSVWPFAALALAIVVSIPLMFRGAYLRGQKAFGLVAVLGVVAAAADLVLAIVFVALQWQTTGAIVALIVAQFLTFVYAAWLARRKGFSGSQRATLFTLPDMRLISPQLRYALVVLVCSLTITALYSIDTIVMKHWFDAHTAGLYAGIATVARIIIFATGSIAQVLLTSVRMDQSARHNQQVLIKSLVLLMGIGGGVLLVFSLAPQLVVRLLMGHEFVAFANLLPRLSLVIFLVSIINLFVLYHLALRRYAVAAVALGGSVATALFLGFNHGTPLAVVNDLLYGCLAFAVLLGVWTISAKTRPTLAPEQNET